MKNIIIYFLLLTLFCSGRCNKEKNDVEGLPPTTQNGKNTLGFTLNGQPWIPKGLVGATSNLSVNVDLSYNNGVFSLTAYQVLSNSKTDYFGIGIKESLNFLNAPFLIALTNNSLFRVYFSNDNCTFYSTDTDTNVSGVLTITKLDKLSRIIVGTFDITLSKSGCNTIRITEGRFDMKY